VKPELLQGARRALAGLMPGRTVRAIESLGRGHINDTLLVTFAAGEPLRAVLQRFNPSVFPEPAKVMANLGRLAAHLDSRLAMEPRLAREWVVVRPLGECAGQPCFLDRGGDCWRLLNYVASAGTREKLESPASAREAGRGLGIFHRLVADLDPAGLYDTLPGFHDTPAYLAAYDRLEPKGPGSQDEEKCRRVIAGHRDLAPVLATAAGEGRISPRVIHGDPRLANMLFDSTSGRVVALVDLDTVKPGLLHHDLGDWLRSCANPAGDDPARVEEVRFDTGLLRQLLAGYLGEAGCTLKEVDFELLYPALRLLAFELGLRFFSDHLAGDRYFRAARPGHNLHRALVQFRLLEEIEKREAEIGAIIATGRLECLAGS
jgi:Ser/Thr protein kinase RdoA (MazF antagonist)